MYVEIGPRQFSIRVYQNEGDEAYIASSQVFAYGDRAFLYSINGAGFYSALPQILDQLGRLKFTSIDGYVGKAHARLLRMQLRGNPEWELSVGTEGILDGHKLSWITVTRKP